MLRRAGEGRRERESGRAGERKKEEPEWKMRAGEIKKSGRRKRSKKIPF
jgi:hypothetical protein